MSSEKEVEDIPMEEHEASVKNFVASVGLTTTEAEKRLKQYGRNELSEKKKSKVRLLKICFLFLI
jgi:hypothetical protein